MTKKEKWVAALAAAAAVAVLWAMGPEPALEGQGRPVPLECAEDDPCWDCRTMGNGVCGDRP